MAMFSGSGSVADRTAAPKTHSRVDPRISIVASGTKVTGRLETDGVVKIEGTVEGTVRAEGQVLVAQGGAVEGDLFARTAVVGGEVRGAIMADERVEIQAGASIEGDITTPQIVVQDGGKVNGNVRMANPQALAKKSEPKKDKNAPAHAEAPVRELRELQPTG